MVKQFMDKLPNEVLSASNIRRFDPDKFKPLVNFLKKNLNTNEKNVELLAWLIDFPARPYSKYVSSKVALAKPVQKHEDLGERAEAIGTYGKEAVIEGKGYRSALPWTNDRLELDKVGHSPDEQLLHPSILPRINRTRRKMGLIHWKPEAVLLHHNESVQFDVPEFGKAPILNPKEELKQADSPDGCFAPAVCAEKETHRDIVLEFPSGVKITVDASDLSLIAQLVKL